MGLPVAVFGSQVPSTSVNAFVVRLQRYIKTIGQKKLGANWVVWILRPIDHISEPDLHSNKGTNLWLHAAMGRLDAVRAVTAQPTQDILDDVDVEGQVVSEFCVVLTVVFVM